MRSTSTPSLTAGQLQGAMHQSTALVGADAREKSMMLVSAQIAMQNPRNEARCLAAMLETCKMPAFAEKAEYRFPRGGKPITGASIHMAREAARAWGNIQCGFEIVSSDSGSMRILGWAWDVQNNTRTFGSDEFKRQHQRVNKATGETEWIEPDERDMRELLNRRASLVVRNAILNLIPVHAITAAREQCDATRNASSAEKLKADKKGTIAKLISAFAKIDVTVPMLERWLKHPLDSISAEERAELLQMWTSIDEGNSAIADYFQREETKADAPVRESVSEMFDGTDATPADISNPEIEF